MRKEKGNPNSTTRIFNNMLVITLIYGFLFVLILFLFGYMTLTILRTTVEIVRSQGIEALESQIGQQYLLFWRLSIAFFLVNFFLLFIFYKKVFQPIESIKKSINNIAHDSESEIKISSNSTLFPVINDINTIKRRIRDLIDREYTAILAKKQAELNALQSQINPHFLYNTLESIRAQAVMDGVENIARMTKALSSMFRYNISQKESLVTVVSELNNLDNYLTIQQYRFMNKFTVIKDFDKTDPIITESQLPKLTIQPIVENAIFHGLEQKGGPGTIKISIYTTQSLIVIQIEDDGVGMYEDQVNKYNELFNKSINQIITTQDLQGDNIGLVNVDERIKLSFGEEFGLHIYSTFGIGTIVEIILPRPNLNIQKVYPKHD